MPVSSRSPEVDFSVIMPVHQGERYLENALQSILDQSEIFRKSLEVIVVDDGSTDKSLHIIEKWKTKLPLVVLSREEGSNWMSATNEGLKFARGTWISFLHQDDRWDPHRLCRLKIAIDENPHVHFFCHPVSIISPSGKCYGKWTPPLPVERALESASILEKLVTQNTMGIPAPCFHKTLLQREKELREDLWFLADWDFWLRLLSQSKNVYCLQKPLASFRIHPDSQTMTRSNQEEDLRSQFHEIRKWVTRQFSGTHPRKQASLLNTELTITLANWSHGLQGYPWRLILGFLKLGPVGATRFIKETCLGQRIWPRLKLRKDGFTHTD